MPLPAPRADAGAWLRARLHAGTYWLVGIAYLALYVALDRVSFVQPFGGFGITPWNPHTGLSFALVLLLGRRYIPFLFLAPMLADLVIRSSSVPLAVAPLLWLVVGAGYSAGALALLSPALRFHTALTRLHDVWMLLLVGVIGTAVVSGLYVSVLAWAGLVRWSAFNVAALRLWVGDLIGIGIVTPSLLLLAAGRWFRVSWETPAQFLFLCAGLWMVFLGPPIPELYRFYFLFLPIIWIALRSGLPGACAGLVVTQIALMAVIEMLVPHTVDVTVYQKLMLILTLTGLVVGGVVMEREQAEYQLRLQQDAHARLTRLGSVNELSAAVVHEINQPLSAAATYTRLVAEELGQPEFSHAQARQIAEKADAQLQRAAAVVQRLRDFIQTGRAEQRPIEVSRLLDAALAIAGPELHRAGVSITCQAAAGLPPVLADSLEIEQVLINLIRNACEAIEASSNTRGVISVLAGRLSGGEIEITVCDSGPGFDEEQIVRPFAPFHTTKPDGLGMGLNLCRSIVEAHGGRIWLANGAHGAEVHFTLPPCEWRAS